MKWFRRTWLALMAIALVAGGVWYLRSRNTAASTASNTFIQIIDVQQGNLDASITVVGELQAVQNATLTFERLRGTTRLLSLTVRPGNQVQAGDVLASIDPAAYQQAVEQARSDLQAAEKKLAELQKPPTALDIAKAEQAVAQAEVNLQQAQLDLAKVESPDLSDLQTAVRNAQDNLTLALLQRTLAEHDSLAKNVRELEYAVDWHGRRITELEVLVAQGRANAEQVLMLADERETLGKVQAELARVRAQRELSLAAAEAEVAKARAALADAREALREAQGSDPANAASALALAKARLAVRDAEVALAAAQEARAQLDQGPDPVALAAAQADVDKKRLALADAEAALAATRLVAPFPATVLQTFVNPGDTIAATSRILSLANLDQLQVIAAVDETAIRSVTPNQPAQITFDAFPGQTLTGRVSSVPLQGSLQGGVTVYQVPITLDDTHNLPLLVGMTANVKILTGQVENALLVPTLALQKSGGLYQVRVPNPADPAQPIAVPVEIGLSDGTYTQIVRGLNPGDQVVVELSAATSSGFNLRGFGSMAFPSTSGQPRLPNR